MPEMPEVETIRRSLCQQVTGRVIQQVETRLPRLIKWPSAGAFQAVVTGKSIEQLTRRGKYLLFELSDGLILVVHLRMTGRLCYLTKGAQWDKYARIAFYLDNGAVLLYADTRTLGTLYLLPQAELWRVAGLHTLGPEPLTAAFTPEYLQAALQSRHGTIKSLLLNQTVIGGLGNIYVDESLAAAGIHPERKASAVLPEEAGRLYQAINQIIADGIAHGGTTFRDYRDGAGQSGSHQHYLRVYGRGNQPCSVCGAIIVKKQVAGRGTHYCPCCQT